mmetsp:Transcript_25198/g.46798  ORF Transcript_25198/g.46798 Transcript_25198/m.46798 type:complete len:527 (-) Transcript_25198:106-1686(-)
MSSRIALFSRVLDLHCIRGALPGCRAVHDDDGLARIRDALPPKVLDGISNDEVGIVDGLEETGLDALEDSERLPGRGQRVSEDDDGHEGPELGDLPGRRSCLGHDNDGLGVDVDGRLDGRGGDGLGSGEVAVALDGRVTYGLEERIEVHGRLGLAASAGHDGDSRLRMFAVGGLAGEHDAVGSVEDGVGHVGTLGAGRTGVRDHGLEHLGRGDYRLAGDVCLPDHVLLGEEDLLGRDFHAQVAAGNHDGVGRSKDLGVVLQSLKVLDLADDFDLPVFLSEDLANLVHVGCLPDEGRGDVVDAVLASPVLDVVNVLLGEGGKVDDDAWKVHILPFSDGGIVLDTAVHFALVDLALEDGEDEGSVGDEDTLSLLDRGGEGRVGARQLALISLERVVGSEGDGLALDKVDLLPLREESRADLGTLGVQHDGDVRVLVLRGRPQSIQTRLVSVVTAVTEVESSDVHAGVDELLELRDLPARGTEGAYDLGTTIDEFRGTLDGFDADETAGEGGDGGGVGDRHGLIKLLFI